MTHTNYTYCEIKQQPATWLSSYEIVHARKKEISGFVHKYLDEGYSVVLTGAGTSAYIGDALECSLFYTIFRGARAIATTDIITNPNLYFDSKSKILLISFARSGNSPESVAAVNLVEKTAGKVAHIFITCNAEGELAKRKGSNILTVLLPPETNDKSLAMTSSYSSMLLTCSLISHIDTIDDDYPLVKTVADAVGKAIGRYENDIKEIAGRDFKRAVFLGSGPLKGVAEESRLKLQELTDGAVMCAFDSFLGFRHGPKAVVNQDTLLVYLLSPNADVRRYEMDLVNQINKGNKIKGAVAVYMKGCGANPAPWDLSVELDIPVSMPSCYGAVAFVFVAQMLGLFKSMDLGLNPDTPSVSGNISRVVEGVTVY